MKCFILRMRDDYGRTIPEEAAAGTKAQALIIFRKVFEQRGYTLQEIL